MRADISPEIYVRRCVVALRLGGHDFDAIALALAECAVDALVAAGFREATLDHGIEQVVDAMWSHADRLRLPLTAGARTGLTLVEGKKP